MGQRNGTGPQRPPDTNRPEDHIEALLYAGRRIRQAKDTLNAALLAREEAETRWLEGPHGTMEEWPTLTRCGWAFLRYADALRELGREQAHLKACWKAVQANGNLWPIPDPTTDDNSQDTGDEATHRALG
jgi:hypothetical protein